MSQSDLLKKIAGILFAQEIPYMLTGFLVSSIQGEPRSTQETGDAGKIRKFGDRHHF